MTPRAIGPRCLTVAAVLSGSALLSAPSASASDLTYGNWGDVAVSVQKTVSVPAQPDGSTSVGEMVTQLAAVGSGQSEISVPVGADQVRNLDGLLSPAVENNAVQYQVNVNGTQTQRVLSSAAPGPITVQAVATINGKPVAPKDLVGATGVLAVTYTVTNTSATQQPLPVTDAKGNTRIEPHEVADPFVGTLDVDLPPGFTEILAPGATTGGAGDGSTRLTYPMMLFPPLGATQQQFSYQARIIGQDLPGATFTFVPIAPSAEPAAIRQHTGLTDNAATASKITSASAQVDATLAELQLSASKLASGLTKTADGNELLAKRLNGRALHRSEVLADGTAALAEDLGKRQAVRADVIDKLVDSATVEADELARSLQSDGSVGRAISAIHDGLRGIHDVAADLPTEIIGLQADLDLLRLRLDKIANQRDTLKGVADPLTGNGSLKQARDQICPTSSDEAACDAKLDAIILTVKDATGKITEALDGDLTTRGAFEIANDMSTKLGRLRIAADLINDGLQRLLEQSDLLRIRVSGPLPDSSASQAKSVADSVLGAAVGADRLTRSLGVAAATADGLADGSSRLAKSTGVSADLATELANGARNKPRRAKAIETDAKKTRGSDVAALSKTSNDLAIATSIKLAQLSAAEAAAVNGAGIPYGLASGPNVVTTGAYRLVVQPSKSDGAAYVWMLVGGIVMLGGAIAIPLFRHSARSGRSNRQS